ncbi:cytochrome P450 9e2-like [Schistocerca cancellata]|uniref:cytochrome P450 9e2-like n=1 Tax=Schistocerca cancellata TaxID=274614 RepID=UPI0021192775|nr:cytochrome P450 9e2-like [Schistocerca cancellata]
MSRDLWSVWAALLAGALLLAAVLWRRYVTHFSRRGVPCARPLPLVGNMLQMTLGRKAIPDVVAELYDRLEPHRYAGVFNFTMPLLMIRDPEIIRAITVKDFDHFTDHVGFETSSKKANPLLKKMLFSLKGKEWHDMRATLSPAFTSMKMKNMFVLMTEIGQQLVDYLLKETGDGEGKTLTLEMKDFFTRVTNDIIATTAFGIKVDSLSDPGNQFYRMGRSLISIRPLVGVGYMMSPRLMEFLGIPFFDPKTVGFFRTMVSDTIETREKQGIVRHDMIHLLMQSRRGELSSHDGDKNGVSETKGRELSEDDIAAQAMLFFFGGFDTVATLLMFLSYLLATHEEVQRRLQEDIDALMQSSGGQPGYEQVVGCQYLDMVISETLRMYTPGAVLDRKCVRPYKLPPTESCAGVEIQPGEGIWVPVHGIHHDPRYYEDPGRFDPERFSPENKHLIKPFTYYPFGSGPRVCIAQRFALMETKVVMTHLLSRFSFCVVEKTPVPLVIQPNNLSLGIKGGAWVGIRRRS